jgi:TPP-dependent pyruvate/acetoin dehydrogenase alpha subunit
MDWLRHLPLPESETLPTREEQLFALMLLIREVEASIERSHRTGRISGSFHSSLGQESCAAGVCLALRSDDIVTSNHRGHGHAIAKGVSPESVIAEMFRRTNGASGGRGGSMHIHDRAVGFYGETAIVAGGLSWAAGAAWGRRRLGQDSMAVAFAGDGAFANGAYAESIRVANFWQSPCLFVCENNGWAHSMESDRVFRGPGAIARIVEAMDVRADWVDGRDPVKVNAVAEELIGYVREGHTALLEVDVYRVKAHSVNDADYRYRPKDAGVEWLKENDPVEAVRPAVSKESQARIESAVEEAVSFALRAALEGDEPPPEDALRGVYSSRELSWHGRG